MAKIGCAVALLVVGTLDEVPAVAQPIDSVFVEIYNVLEDPSGDGGPPLTTYRIWVDLAKGYELQMVYGSEHHRLRIGTTTEFFNASEGGVQYAYELNAALLDQFPIALDSWLTIGAASERHMAVPRDRDMDGSILTCPPYPMTDFVSEGTSRPVHDPLCRRDGLLPVDSVPRVVNFHMSTDYLGDIRGSVVEHTDAAWAVLGGMKGATPDDLLLIAQITTTGELSYTLNLQVGAPDGSMIQCVASDPRAGEILVEDLRFPRN